MADVATKKAFRELEKQLDVYHRDLPLYRLDISKAVYALLAAFDGMYLIDMQMALLGTLGIGETQFRKKYEDGLTQGLRWIFKGPETIDFSPTDQVSVIDQAGEFILHAADYYNLCDFHVMFGKNLVDVEADLATKKVRFLSPPNQTPRQAITGFAETVENLKKHRLVTRPQDLMPVFEAALPAMRAVDHELLQGRIVITNPLQMNEPSIVALQRSFRHEFEDIPGTADLVGFTVDAYQSFWSALARWSLCASQLYIAELEAGTPQNRCMPTQCVDKTYFIETIGALTGLPRDTVMAIVERLRWGPSIKNSDVFLQPLLSGADTVAWSARVIEVSNYPRNLLRLMARMSGAPQDAAVTIIGAREVPAVRRLGQFLAEKRQKGWQYKLRRVVAANGEAGEIDYLGWNSNSDEEVLLIEYKATLDVDEINEVSAATDEMINGQDQLRRCIRILNALSVEEKKAIYPFVPWAKVKRIYGIVVSGGCEPNEKYDHSEFPGISAAAFRSRVPSRDFVRPSRLWESCRQRSWLSHLDALTDCEEEFRIGDLTYFVPSLTGEESRPQARPSSADAPARPASRNRETLHLII